VKVTGIPNPVEAGGIGMFSAKVDTGNGISAWPRLVDCLPAGVELPPLDAAMPTPPGRWPGHLGYLATSIKLSRSARAGWTSLHSTVFGEQLHHPARSQRPNRLGHHHRHRPVPTSSSRSLPT